MQSVFSLVKYKQRDLQILIWKRKYRVLKSIVGGHYLKIRNGQ